MIGDITALIFSHSPIQKFLKLSDVFQRWTNPATKAAIPAITRVTGLIAEAIALTKPSIFVATKTVAITAPKVLIKDMLSFTQCAKSTKPSTISGIFATILLATFPKASAISISPFLISARSNVLFTDCTAPLRGSPNFS